LSHTKDDKRFVVSHSVWAIMCLPIDLGHSYRPEASLSFAQVSFWTTCGHFAHFRRHGLREGNEVMRPHHQKPDRNITRQTQFCTMKDRMALAKRSSWWVLISETCRQRWVQRWNSMPNSFRRPSVGWQHLPLHLSRSPGIGIHCGRSHVTVRRMGYPEGLAEAADKRSCDSHSGKKCVVGLMLFMAKPLSRRT